MIVDTLQHIKKYESLNPLFPKVIEFIENNDLSTLKAGVYEIEHKNLFVTISISKGKTPAEAILETHNNMIDIQIPLSTTETYGYTPRDILPEAVYNAENDISFFPDIAAESYVSCHPGSFIIFFPQDAHAPCICGTPEIKKAIFKVKA